MGRQGDDIRLTGNFRDYAPIVIQNARMVITEGGKVVKDRDGFTPRQATKAEIDGAEPVAPS